MNDEAMGTFARTALRAVALAAAALFGGCAGVRPSAPAAAAVVPPAAWRGDVVEQGEASGSWWDSFGDPGLTKVVNDALANNLDVAIAASRVDEIRAGLAAAQAQRLPLVGGEATRVRDRDINPAYGVAELQTGSEVGVSLSFDADLFGRLRASSAAARATLLSTRAVHAEVRLQVASLAAREYLTLQALDKRLETLMHTLDARAQSLRIMQRRAAAGYASQLDLSQAQADYAAAEALVPTTKLSISTAEDALSTLLGANPRTIERGDQAIGIEAVPVPVSLPSALLRRRPDLVAAEDQVVAADHSLDAARAAFMPDLQLSASFAQVSSTLFANGPIDVFSFGGSLLAPLIDAGRLRAQEDAVAARRDQAALAYRRATLRAFSEVEDALASTQRTREQLVPLKAQQAALQRSLALATRRYQAGYSAYLEQLDAQRSLLGADLSIAQAQADHAIAYVRLFEALGGGWDAGQLLEAACAADCGRPR